MSPCAAAADEFTLQDDGTVTTRREHVEMSRYPQKVSKYGRLCGPGLLINPGGGTARKHQCRFSHHLFKDRPSIPKALIV